MTREELSQRIEAVERAYEFFLAFAAQGVKNDRDSKVGGQLRQSLDEMARALDGLSEGASALLDPAVVPVTGQRFLEALRQDAQTTESVLSLIASRDSISSQLIDNLNASIHVRALLTDLFLLDELLA